MGFKTSFKTVTTQQFEVVQLLVKLISSIETPKYYLVSYLSMICSYTTVTYIGLLVNFPHYLVYDFIKKCCERRVGLDKKVSGDKHWVPWSNN